MGVVFVKRCILCGELLPAAGTGKAMLCPACAGEVRQSYRCTEPVCITGADDAAAALYYTGKVQHAMQGLKFHHKQHYADWFAAQMLPLLAERLDAWQPDLITYMPIGLLRLRERGYNQAELLAKAVAKPFRLPCIATLRKRAFTPKQSTRKDATARQQNAAREQGIHITARVNTSCGIRCRGVAETLPGYARPEEPTLEDAFLAIYGEGQP